MGKSAGATREGRGSGASHASLSGEQRTKVQSAFKSHRSNAKVDIRIDARVGVAVPRNVTLIDVPEDVVVIVPEWRHYRYVLIGDLICLVDPDTYEIVHSRTAARKGLEAPDISVNVLAATWTPPNELTQHRFDRPDFAPLGLARDNASNVISPDLSD